MGSVVVVVVVVVVVEAVGVAEGSALEVAAAAVVLEGVASGPSLPHPLSSTVPMITVATWMPRIARTAQVSHGPRRLAPRVRRWPVTIG
jgi:hypothetical protein